VLPPILKRCWEDPATTGVDIRAVAGYWLRRDGEGRVYEYLSSHRRHLDAAGLLELARLSRRRGQQALALEIWRELAGHDNLEALERLAKHYEHVARDLDQALGLHPVPHRPEAGCRGAPAEGGAAAAPAEGQGLAAGGHVMKTIGVRGKRAALVEGGT
jgi:hypothetical protein